MRIPVIFCIDVEPDPRLVNRSAPEPWTGYEFSQRYFTELRPRIEAVTGAPAHYSWFFRMDPQVAEAYGSPTWAVDRYESHIKEIESHGDELGVHPHAWRWCHDQGNWFHDFGDQSWVEHCIRMSLDAFASALGRPCRAFRFGDRWLNTPTVDLAEELGVYYDLTVEPGTPELPTPRTEERASGPLPDYYRVPRQPWAPSKVDFRRPASKVARSIRMIPLTSGALQLGIRPRSHLWRIRKNGFRNRLQSTPLYMFSEWTSPNTFARMLDGALSAQHQPYLAFAIRTDIGERFRHFQWLVRNLHALLTHPSAPRFTFCTPAEALRILDS